MSTRSKPVPVPDALSEPFWEAAKRHVLLIQRCAECRRYQHPPSFICLSCPSDSLGYEEVSGKAIIQSFTVILESPVVGFEPGVPIIHMAGELAEQSGLLMNANLVGADPTSVEIGMEVTVVWEDLRNGFVLPNFALTSGVTK